MQECPREYERGTPKKIMIKLRGGNSECWGKDFTLNLVMVSKDTGCLRCGSRGPRLPEKALLIDEGGDIR